MKKLILFSFSILMSLFSISAHADLAKMMKIYNNPEQAPKIQMCKGDKYCNAFYALSLQWQDIPKNWKYDNEWDILKSARIGDSYRISRGFYLYKQRTIDIRNSAEFIIFPNKQQTDQEGKIAARGLAVLMYIEDKNKWLED